MQTSTDSQLIHEYPVARQVEHWNSVALWRSRFHLVMTMLVFGGAIASLAAMDRISPSQAIGLAIVPLAVNFLASTLLRNGIRFVEDLLLPAGRRQSKSELFRSIIQKFGSDSIGVIENVLRYRDVLRSIAWIISACLLSLSFFTGFVNEIAFLVVVASFANQIAIEVAESAAMRIGFPNLKATKKPTPMKSIDRGPLATPTIQPASALVPLAKTLAKKERQAFPSRIVWGGLPIRDSQACNHFFIHGEIGSGKSIVLKELVSQAIQRAGDDSDQRIFLDDPKGDMVEFLRDKKVDNYIMVNPFDERGFGWDIQKDLNTKTRVEDFAELLIPVENLNQPFFAESARECIEIVLNCFNQRASSWTLRDLVLAFRRVTIFSEIAEYTEQGQTFLENQTMSEKTFSNVLSETRNTIKKLESLAAACDAALQADKSFSVHDFCTRKTPEQLWLLTRNNDAKGAIDRLCRFLFYFQYLEMKTWPEVKSPRTWAFIDEARLLADLPELSVIADEGRSKGVTLVFATQSHGDFVESAKRNPKAAAGFAERIPNKALLRCHSKDAKWSSDQFGEVFKTHKLDGTSFNSKAESRSFSSNDHVQKMPAIPPHVFTEMKAASSDGIEYMVISDPEIGGGFWKASHAITTPFPRSDPNVKQRSQNVLEKLRPWNREDLERLGLTDLQSLFEFDEESYNSGTKTYRPGDADEQQGLESPELEIEVDVEQDDLDDDVIIPGIDF